MNFKIALRSFGRKDIDSLDYLLVGVIFIFYIYGHDIGIERRQNTEYKHNKGIIYYTDNYIIMKIALKVTKQNITLKKYISYYVKGLFSPSMLRVFASQSPCRTLNNGRR